MQKLYHAVRYFQLLVLFFLCLIPRFSKAQIPLFAHTWGGGNNEGNGSIAVDHNGNIYITGWTESSVSGNSDVLLLKYTNSGALAWAKSWDFGSQENATGIAVDPDGNVVITGMRNFPPSTATTLLAKVDSNGTLLWARAWTRYWDGASMPIIDANGNIFEGGSTYPSDIDAYLAKYDNNGNILWLRTWDKNINNASSGVAMVADGYGYIYLATSTGVWDASGPHDVVLMKFDTTGAKIWDQQWNVGGPTTNQGAGSVALDGAGNVYVAGWTNGSGAGGRDAILLKYDVAGNLMWQKTWGGNGDEDASSIAVDAGGNIFVVGTTFSFGASTPQLFLLKYDGTGTLLSQKVWGGSIATSGGRAKFDATCNLVIGGVAPNASGIWYDISGTDSIPPGSSAAAGGTVNTISVSQFTPPITETSFAGIQDTGGGGNDLLLFKLQSKGDLNHDGSLSPADVVLELNCVFLATGDCDFCFTDMNCDASITPSDVVILLNATFLGAPIVCLP